MGEDLEAGGLQTVETEAEQESVLKHAASEADEPDPPGGGDTDAHVTHGVCDRAVEGDCQQFHSSAGQQPVYQSGEHGSRIDDAVVRDVEGGQSQRPVPRAGSARDGFKLDRGLRLIRNDVAYAEQR